MSTDRGSAPPRCPLDRDRRGRSRRGSRGGPRRRPRRGECQPPCRRWPRSSSPTRDRRGLQARRLARDRRSGRVPARARRRGSGRSVRVGRADARRDVRPRGHDARWVGGRRSVPAADRVDRGGRNVRRGDRPELAGAAFARRCRAPDAGCAGVACRARRRSRAPVLYRRGALRVVRADGPHRPADRTRQRAHGRSHPRARAGPGGAPGQRGLVRDVRCRRLPRHQRRGRPRGGRRRPASSGGRAGRNGPAGRHRRTYRR